MNRALIIASLLVFTSACSDRAKWKPSDFFFSVGDSFTHAYELKLRDGELYYYEFQPNPTGDKHIQPVKLQPTDAQWKDFRRTLDKCAVWQWQKNYEANILDGWGWGLKIQYGDRQLDSGGFNNSPESFEEVLRAAERLAGGKSFRVDR